MRRPANTRLNSTRNTRTQPIGSQVGIVPCIWLYTSSTTKTIREWMYRKVLYHLPPTALGLVRLLHIDANRNVETFVPSSGDTSLDEQQVETGNARTLESGGAELAAQVKKQRYSYLRFVPLALLTLASSQDGARNCPTLGYALLLYNLMKTKYFLTDQLQSLIQNRQQVAAMEAGFWVAAGGIRIYIVWAPGGNGNGISVGCADLFRIIGRELGVQLTIIAIKLRPGVFNGSKTQRLRAVTFAQDMELAAAQTGQWVRMELPTAPEGSESVKLTFHQAKPFDVVYQLESINAAEGMGETTVAHDNLVTFLGMVAQFGFLVTFTRVGGMLRARLHDDMGDQLMARDEYGLMKNLLSFGLAEICLPEKELRRYAPFALVLLALESMRGQPLSEEDRNQLLVRTLHRLGLDEWLLSLLEQLSLQKLEEEQPRLMDRITARFRDLQTRTTQEQLNQLPALTHRFERDIREQVEDNKEPVLEAKRQLLESIESEVGSEHGLAALEEHHQALSNFLSQHQMECRSRAEESSLARDMLLQQKTEMEGQLAELRELAFGPAMKCTLLDRLTGVDLDMERQNAQLVARQHISQLVELERDHLILQLEMVRQQAAMQVLEQLEQQLAESMKRLRASLACLEACEAQVQPEVESFQQLDFSFHVPMGFCLIGRTEPQRQADVDYFLDELVLDSSQEQTVERVLSQFQSQVGDFWHLDQPEQLTAQLLELFQQRIGGELDLWGQMKQRLSDEQLHNRIHQCVRASAEYLLTDTALTHGDESWIRIVAAPQHVLAPLQEALVRLGHPHFLPVETYDPNRISFLQVRVGVPLYAIKSHQTHGYAYREQFNPQRDPEERGHIQPEWRFLPDGCPLEDWEDPRFGAYVLQGVVSGRLKYRSGQYLYQPFEKPEQFMGTNEMETSQFLMAHQTHFSEMVSSFYMLFHTQGYQSLRQTVAQVTAQPGPFSVWLGQPADNLVQEQLAWVAKNYDVGQ